MKILLCAFSLCCLSAAAISQNVGIGTTTPTKAGLQVDRAVGATYAMFGSQTTGVSIEAGWPGIGLNTYYNGGRKYIADGYGGLLSMDPVSGNFTVYTGPFGNKDAAATITQKLTIFKSGNVGLGSAPLDEAQLFVADNNSRLAVFHNTDPLIANARSGIYLKQGAVFTGGMATVGESALTARLGFFTFATQNQTALEERMSITDGGNVGINTTTPSASLHVNGSFRLVNGSQGFNKILVSDANGNASWQNRTNSTGNVSVYYGQSPWNGYVTTPGSSTVVLPWDVETNVGGSWDPTNNLYVAPVSGYYYYSYQLYPFTTTYTTTSSFSVNYEANLRFYGGDIINTTRGKGQQEYNHFTNTTTKAVVEHSGIIYLEAANTISLGLYPFSSVSMGPHQVYNTNRFLIYPIK